MTGKKVDVELIYKAKLRRADLLEIQKLSQTVGAAMGARELEKVSRVLKEIKSTVVDIHSVGGGVQNAISGSVRASSFTRAGRPGTNYYIPGRKGTASLGAAMAHQTAYLSQISAAGGTPQAIGEAAGLLQGMIGHQAQRTATLQAAQQARHARMQMIPHPTLYGGGGAVMTPGAQAGGSAATRASFAGPGWGWTRSLGGWAGGGSGGGVPSRLQLTAQAGPWAYGSGAAYGPARASSDLLDRGRFAPSLRATPTAVHGPAAGGPQLQLTAWATSLGAPSIRGAQGLRNERGQLLLPAYTSMSGGWSQQYDRVGPGPLGGAGHGSWPATANPRTAGTGGGNGASWQLYRASLRAGVPAQQAAAAYRAGDDSAQMSLADAAAAGAGAGGGAGGALGRLAGKAAIVGYALRRAPQMASGATWGMGFGEAAFGGVGAFLGGALGLAMGPQFRAVGQRMMKDAAGTNQYRLAAQGFYSIAGEPGTQYGSEIGGHLRGAGAALGFDPAQTAQIAARTARGAGGWAGPGMDQNVMLGLFGARMGLSNKAVGNLSFAGRRGGLGMSGRMFAEHAWMGGLGSGLEGGELVDLLETAGRDASVFRSTGMGTSRSGFQGATGASRGLGIDTFQGSRIGHGLRQSGRSRSLRGPQGFLDVLMLQQFGGLGRLGSGVSFSALRSARKRMESGAGFTPGNIGSFVDRLIQMGGGGAGGEYLAQQSLLELGVPVGTGLMEEIGQYRSTGQMPQGVVDAFRKGGAKAGGFAAGGGLAGQLEGTTDSQLGQLAAAANRVHEAAMQLEGGLVAMQKAQARITESLVFYDGAVQRAAAGLTRVGDIVEGIGAF